MPPAVDRTPSSTTSTPLSGRRLISRIASPFASKTRSVTDFYIEVTNPHKQYSPGDTVSGCVKLRVVKPIRVTHVVICLHGFVQVYKNPGSPPPDGYRANSAYLSAGRGSRAGEYFGNGFASLFEDEIVLCGDGRLAEGLYQFNFNLEFPDRDLPSSISFERGTISYMITTTLTRPTTISPTIHCDHKVYMVQSIDVSHYLPPKPRMITLEAISRKSRAKTQARKLVDSTDRRSQNHDSTRPSEERRSSHSSSSQGTRTDGIAARSCSPSEMSLDSAISSLAQQESSINSPRLSEMSNVNSSRTSLPGKTITCTVESLVGGCLRGDGVPVRVTVNHTKYVKSLYGVIITLYRQARVDTHPTIPLGPIEKGKEAKYEDYYPKSLSGLGGLSLSGAGSNHIFRKDLSQVMLPLIVDPGSLTAEVNGKVHIPDEAFPTISTVPGAMISFRYYIEVVVDIQGKLSSQDRNLSNLGGLASTITNSASTVSASMEGMNGERSAFNPFGSPVIDTTPIRRDKGVVASTFEVIVGTIDSERRKGKRKVEIPREPQPPAQELPRQQRQSRGTSDAEQAGAFMNRNWDDAPYEENYDHSWYSNGGQEYSNGAYTPYHAAYTHHSPVPMPQVEDESLLPEKERLRRAEARLLPSQPPGMDDPGVGTSHVATAPVIPEETEYEYRFTNADTPLPGLMVLPPTHEFSPADGPSSPSAVGGAAPLPRTPDYEPSDPASAPPGTVPPHDDKRQLERQRLAMEASAPPIIDVSSERGHNNDLDDAGPSAPALHEVDGHHEIHNNTDDSHADAPASSGLPRYE